MMDTQILLRLAKLSAAAYLIAEADLIAAVEALGYTYVARLATDQCVAVIVSEEYDGVTEIILAFQGTRFAQNTDPEEIWDDLDDGVVDLGQAGKAHRGFYAPMLAMWPDIMQAIPAGCKLLTLTGHSLGGVRANLALRLAHDAGFSPVAVSFGAPKGADKTFWDQLGIVPTRVVNRHDFAPLWPLADERWVQPEPMAWLNKTGALEMVVGWRGILPSIADHDIDNYIASLEALNGANLDTAAAAV